MTTEQIKSLNLGLEIDTRTEITINSGIEWLKNNTTIDISDIENFPNSAKLFLIKFVEMQSRNQTVSSQSIEGLSVSFNESGIDTMLWDIANNLLSEHIKSKVRFVFAERKFV